MVSFPSLSSHGERRCLQFRTGKDTIVEEDEEMVFQATTQHSLDFIENSTFSITIFDDDGK
jgi:hypothetical protein